MNDKASSAKVFGQLLKKQLQQDPHFYFFSPDETTSNKMAEVYDVATRLWNLPTAEWDLPSSRSGQIVELLSENILLAMMIGHVLSGEPAMLASYEAFLTIVVSQLLQHLKFLEQASQVSWRPDYPALNLLSTSTCWRQDHNGFSHQSPMLISTLLDRPGNYVNCLFPVDHVAAEAAFKFMLNSTNVVNITTFNKTDEPTWLEPTAAEEQLTHGGVRIFDFISDENPDFILAAAGDISTREAIYAVSILRRDLPTLRYRVVNLAALTHQAIGTTTQALSQDDFDRYFTKDKPIIINFHGYPVTIKSIFTNYASPDRLQVHGFCEQGSTTTPFEILNLNQSSRYHLCIDVAKAVGRNDLVQKYQDLLVQNSQFAKQSGQDLPEIIDFVL